MISRLKLMISFQRALLGPTVNLKLVIQQNILTQIQQEITLEQFTEITSGLTIEINNNIATEFYVTEIL